MGIPKKALKHSDLKYQDKAALADSSHQTFRVNFEEDGVTKHAFFKKLDPENHYPELLAKMSVAASSFKRSFQGKRSAEERLVFDDNEKLIGTLSIAVDGFRPFNFANEVIANPALKEQVVPSVKTLIAYNMMELLVGRWFLHDDDTHPHNLSLLGDIDFDMLFYWLVIYMKKSRPVIGVPITHVTHSVPDYEAFPCIHDAMPYHWPTYEHPGQESIPVVVPGVQEQALKFLPKAYADPSQFARLAQNPVAQEQKLAALLKILLTFQPELQRKRLTELFGELTLNYTSLDLETQRTYETLFPRFFNAQTNINPFIDFMMEVYQEHYDSIYRVVVFHMGCTDNRFGVPLPPTSLALYQKPSFYRDIEEWVKKENATTYSGNEELQFNLAELQMRYHQVWRDAFAPTLKELLYGSYRLTNSLLREATSIQPSEMERRNPVDENLTSAWQLFGNLPVLSADVVESKFTVDKNSKLRDSLLALVAFTNEFHAITKAYYIKERQQLTEEDNLEFAIKLNSLHQQYNLKIRQSLANTTTYASEFNSIASSLKVIADQVNFQLHLTTNDEFMEKSVLAVKKEVLPYTHEEVKKEYHDALFVWAKNTKPELLQQYIVDIIDTKYTNNWSLFSNRHRGTLVKQYLRDSKHESGDNRLAYILSSGKTEDGALNTLLIRGLTTKMLESHPIPSIDKAIRDQSFKAGITDVTKHVVAFARKDKRFTHAFSKAAMSAIFKTVYEWIDTVTDKCFADLIHLELKRYENNKSLITKSRRSEVIGYLREKPNSKALALIFKNGDASTFSKLLFGRIINLIKAEIKKTPEIALQENYKLILQFNLEEHQDRFLKKIKDHHETLAASDPKLRLTYELTG